MAPGQTDDSAIGNLTALLGDPEVHNFVDDVIEAHPFPPSNLRSLVEQVDGDTLRRADRYSSCGKCVEVFSSSTTNFFVQQVREACLGPLALDTAKRFCDFLQRRIASLDQFFNGYLSHRSRSRQLATATCIEDNKCSSRNAYDSFFNPIIPGRLVNLVNFPYCPRVTYRSVTTCTKDVLPRVERFAYDRVRFLCNLRRVRDDLKAFCAYFNIDRQYGRGMVASLADLYGYTTGYCVRNQCCQDAAMA
ncbi:hypothetical protein FOL47_010927 [Perkinsus chesapeaki]|uniref:Uncharacterized protein n=1 Tax=Perkinsus chesapeaki TaxID=330153 RepID=A0A7J6N1V4_PERCH|nr:hypothetical protein FOL47_010927 [Perkinsus chesapeaki]